MMSWIIFLVFGGVVGWVASLIMHTDGQQGIILNVIVGIVGAMIGVVIFAMVSNGMNMMNASQFLQQIIIGSILLAVLIFRYFTKKK